MKQHITKILSAVLIIICIMLCGFLVKAWFDGKFDSVETLQAYLKTFGVFGPVVLTLVQALQVVLPILPGFLGCMVGGILFGPWLGFICNYIGISLGSLAAFWIARKFGVMLVKKLFSEKKYEKWSGWAEKSKSYAAFLFIATLLPLFPDDFLCYFSGLTNMRFKKFTWIIILGKPWCILAYSFGFSLINWDYIINLIFH